MTDLATNLSALEDRLTAELAGVADAAALEELRVRFLGRSGEVTAIRRGIGALAPEERPNAGKVINAAVERMEAALSGAIDKLGNAQLEAQLSETIDVTLPGPPARIGSIHPIRRVMRDIGSYFTRLGFAVLQGPEIETDANNFDALNIPADHPAREGLDSFYLRPDLVLRTHTSPMQVRAMRESGPPIAIIVPGKAYRRDAVDARHLYQFHQIEGLMIGTDIHFGHLKGVLTGMMRELFGPQQEVRFRPSFFPFTEPSAEIDTTCPGCAGTGKRADPSTGSGEAPTCRTCGGSGWIEIGGSGMVHPNVLREVGYDPERVAGWAFGVGPERLAMVRYEMNDIRDFVENTPSFLEQTA
jgi:phenylalanyl-tRNA synthetase alpha chain